MSEAPTADALLAVAVEAATGAGALLLERARRGREHHVSSKSTPTDLVSEADLASEQRDPRAAGSTPPATTASWARRAARQGSSGLSWVVDPLDGTVNFLFGIPQWCVSVAVRDERGTLAGAVYDPNRNELFTATSGRAPAAAGPARRGRARAGARGRSGRAARRGDSRARWSPPGSPTTPTCAPRRRGCSSALIPRVRDIRRFGSAALDLTWTAAGRYDAYFERTVKPWDIAAGALICERAGLWCSSCPCTSTCPGGSSWRAPGAGRRSCWSSVGDGVGVRSHTLDAAGGTRTHTPFRTGPFEGPASTVPPPPQACSTGEDIRAAQAGYSGWWRVALRTGRGSRRSSSTFQPCLKPRMANAPAGSARARSAA